MLKRSNFKNTFIVVQFLWKRTAVLLGLIASLIGLLMGIYDGWHHDLWAILFISGYAVAMYVGLILDT